MKGIEFRIGEKFVYVKIFINKYEKDFMRYNKVFFKKWEYYDNRGAKISPCIHLTTRKIEIQECKKFKFDI